VLRSASLPNLIPYTEDLFGKDAEQCRPEAGASNAIRETRVRDFGAAGRFKNV
jgi:hypothetical protein